jgi:1-phosphofructokinase
MKPAVFTLTMSPALDYVMSVPGLIPGGMNRSVERRFSEAGSFFPAGKGVNVSLALKGMGVESTAICLRGKGFIGDEFSRLLGEQGVEAVMIPVDGCDTRINAKLESGDSVTEINGSFSADEKVAAKVCDTLRVLKSGDFLVIGGSLPWGVETGFYAKLTQELSEKGVNVIVDTSGEPLRKVVEGGEAFFVKPNRQEFNELYEQSHGKVSSLDEAVINAKRLHQEFGGGILISMGKSGAVMVINGKDYVCRVPLEVRGYAVKAGDTLIAGFIADYLKTNDLQSALCAGVDSATNYIQDGK